MNARIATIALLLAGTTACSEKVLQSTTRTSMLVEDRSSVAKRFWVTLVDQRTNERFSRISIGGKRCSKGPSRLGRGQVIEASIQMFRNSKTGVVTRSVDKNDLGKRFC